jgi:hypothetical protein
VIAGVVDTDEQFISCDNDTGNNFIAGDNDTSGQLEPATTTPAINLLTVTRTGHHGVGERPRIGES